MKALKILTVLCFILVVSTNNANSQIERGTQWSRIHLEPAEVPCLTYTVTNKVLESFFQTKFTYHAKGGGELISEGPERDIYTVEYEYNYVRVDHNNEYHVERITFPILLKHDGKLVAVIHRYAYMVINANGVLVAEGGGISRVECK
jgi:hypothetical protein